jgi:hypothetical protein
MDLNVGKERAALNRMTVDALRARYAEVSGEETSSGPRQISAVSSWVLPMCVSDSADSLSL